MKIIKLLDILVPQIKYFFILISDIEKIGIEKYNSINIDFSPRIVVKDGKSQILSSPIISYRIELKKENKRKLYKLFKEKTEEDNKEIIGSRFSSIILTKYNYNFPVEIMVAPSFLEYDKLPKIFARSVFKDIHIKLKLKDTELSLFDHEKIEYDNLRTRYDKDKLELLKKEFNLLKILNKDLIKDNDKLKKDNKILRNKFTRFDIMEI